MSGPLFGGSSSRRLEVCFHSQRLVFEEVRSVRLFQSEFMDSAKSFHLKGSQTCDTRPQRRPAAIEILSYTTLAMSPSFRIVIDTQLKSFFQGFEDEHDIEANLRSW